MLPVPAPLAIVASPVLLTETAVPLLICDIDTTVPAPLLGSGFAAGKLVSLAIATKHQVALVTASILIVYSF